MDELKLRLEYLEHITKAPENEPDLLEQVDTIGLALNTMLDVHKQEVGRLAHEVNKQVENSSEETPSEKSDSENPTVPSGPTGGLATEVKSGIVVSRFESLAKLTNELEMHAPIEVPEPVERPNMEHLVAKASELGREFDELTMRSAELTKKLSEKIVEENRTNCSKGEK